jgi:thiol:disulfide interchange protein
MVWKINKHKKSDRQGKTERQRRVIKKKKPVVENQPKLRSCLKSEELVKQRESLNDSSKHQDDPSNNKARDQSFKSTGSRGARSSSGIVSTDMESKGSVNPSLLFNNRKRVASVEQQSASSRSWDRESRKSETGHSAHSSQASERSSAADSRSHKSHVKEPKKKVRFAAILIRDYERVVGDNPSCTIGPPVG